MSRYVSRIQSWNSICRLQVNLRSHADELFQKKLSNSKYQWIRDRITRLWPDWKQAAKAFETENPTFRQSLHMLVVNNSFALLSKSIEMFKHMSVKQLSYIRIDSVKLVGNQNVLLQNEKPAWKLKKNRNKLHMHGNLRSQ